MDLEDFVERAQNALLKRRAALMEQFLKSLSVEEYHKLRGRVAELNDFSATLDQAYKETRVDADGDEDTSDG